MTMVIATTTKNTIEKKRVRPIEIPGTEKLSESKQHQELFR